MPLYRVIVATNMWSRETERSWNLPGRRADAQSNAQEADHMIYFEAFLFGEAK